MVGGDPTVHEAADRKPLLGLFLIHTPSGAERIKLSDGGFKARRLQP
jgi:hypothetical protein